MITKNDRLTLIGFILFFIGMLSIFLALVGIHFSFLAFIERLGKLPAFLIKVMMAISGVVIIYLSKIHYPTQRTSDEEEDEQKEDEEDTE